MKGQEYFFDVSPIAREFGLSSADFYKKLAEVFINGDALALYGIMQIYWSTCFKKELTIDLFTIRFYILSVRNLQHIFKNYAQLPHAFKTTLAGQQQNINIKEIFHYMSEKFASKGDFRSMQNVLPNWRDDLERQYQGEKKIACNHPEKIAYFSSCLAMAELVVSKMPGTDDEVYKTAEIYLNKLFDSGVKFKDRYNIVAAAAALAGRKALAHRILQDQTDGNKRIDDYLCVAIRMAAAEKREEAEEFFGPAQRDAAEVATFAKRMGHHAFAKFCQEPTSCPYMSKKIFSSFWSSLSHKRERPDTAGEEEMTSSNPQNNNGNKRLRPS